MELLGIAAAAASNPVHGTGSSQQHACLCYLISVYHTRH